jgi:4-amino-4-deoxy-L-arabinose transferase-like glycosyltransferase
VVDRKASVPNESHSQETKAWVLNAQTQRNLTLAVILLATLNALLWSIVRLPGLGGPDEAEHFRIVQQMITNGGLPIFEGYGPGRFAGGPVRAQVAHEITPNAFAVVVAGILSLNNSASNDMNFHIARLFNVALYPVTLWLAFLTLRRVFPHMPVAPIWGVVLMATIPMFTLVHSYYTNDTPAIAAGTFAVYATVRALQSDFGRWDVVMLGIGLGLVALHKYTGFLIFPTVAAATIWQLARRPLRFIRVALVLVTITAALAGWWYIRNWILYGDPIGVEITQAAVNASGGAPIPPRARGLNLFEFVKETNWIAETFSTFWGGYGLEKMKLPGAAYVLFSSLLVLATVGHMLSVCRNRNRIRIPDRPPMLLIMGVLHLGLWAVNFWSSYTVDVALHGRYVYPTFVPFVILIIAGLSTIVPWKGRGEAMVLITVPVMLMANAAYFMHTLLPDVLAWGAVR